MRFLCFLFLVAFAGAVGIFAYQNRDEIPITFLEWSITVSLPVVAAVIYVLGMLTGWSLIGMVRRSVNRIVQPGDQRA